jgi:MFS family permease
MLINNRPNRIGSASNRRLSVDARYIYYGLIVLQYFSISLTASNGTIYYLMHGVTKSWVAYLGVIGSVTIVLFEFPTGIVADKIGPSISVLISFLLRGVASLLVIFCYGPLMFAVITFLGSVGYTFFSGASEAWIFNTDSSIKVNMGNFFANSFMMNGAARIIGGTAGGLLASSNPRIPFIFSGSSLIFTAALFFFYLILQGEGRPIAQPRPEQKNFLQLKKEMGNTVKIILADKVLSLMTMSGVFFIIFCVIPLIYWQPFFFESAKSMSALGGIWALFITMNLAGNLASKTNWVKRHDRIFLFKTMILLCGISLLFAALAKKQIYISLISFFVYHFFLGILGPTRSIIINQRIDDKKRASILSFMSFTESFGTMFSYMIFGYLCSFFELKWILALSTIPLALAFWAATRIKEDPTP